MSSLRGFRNLDLRHGPSASVSWRSGLRGPFKLKLARHASSSEQERREIQALGWDATQEDGSVPLTLRGWAPHYFPITRKGSDSDVLAQNTLENSRDPKLQEALEYLKDR
ncbi:hypothetical protein NUW54_g3236 [Trametes sanguinea]|uniref:Uncharacterized protein n=1 Tax=Trametes sanguinea TaxID=158606 RepID=A0ACC1Q2R4_9APHY|nr:hypothetical protein NUW54_g3236 [Trametes sanguinea]